MSPKQATELAIQWGSTYHTCKDKHNALVKTIRAREKSQ